MNPDTRVSRLTPAEWHCGRSLASETEGQVPSCVIQELVVFSGTLGPCQVSWGCLAGRGQTKRQVPPVLGRGQQITPRGPQPGPPAFMRKVLLEHSCALSFTRSFIFSLRLLLRARDRAEQSRKRARRPRSEVFTIWPFTGKVCSHLGGSFRLVTCSFVSTTFSKGV